MTQPVDSTPLITAPAKQGGVVQNGLGVLFAIGWGTFLYLQNKQKVKTEEHLEAKLTSEQSAVTELKQEVCLSLSPPYPGCKYEHDCEAQKMYRLRVVADSPPLGLLRQGVMKL